MFGSLRGKNKVLAVAAHPDDEVLGCGGAMARHVEMGHEVRVVIMAEGVTSRDDSRDLHKRKEELEVLRETARKANAILGVNSVSFVGLPDNRMDGCELLDVIKALAPHIEGYRPETIYTHHPGDLNIDHRITYDAVCTVTRPQPGDSVKAILLFEVPSSTHWRDSSFAPNFHVEITGTLGVKLGALEAYASEMRPWPHARSIQAVEHLARWRGPCVGVEAAEAFMLARGVF